MLLYGEEKRENSKLYQMSPGTDAYCSATLIFAGKMHSDVQSCKRCNCLRARRGVQQTRCETLRPPLRVRSRSAAAREPRHHERFSSWLLASPKQGLILQRQTCVRLPGGARCRTMGLGFGLSQLCFPFSESPGTAAVCDTS